MKPNVSQEAAALEQLSMAELRAKFAELFGEATRAGNRTWLVRRILWRLQALAYGDLSERARRRAAELANDADLRLSAPPPRPVPPVVPAPSAAGRPTVGAVLVRRYKGQRLEVHVQADGFRFQNTVYASLSAVAQAITGAHWNGRLFFGLKSQGGVR